MELLEPQGLQSKIYTIRGVKVMLDRDLAELYQVETKYLNKAVKRNLSRFPINFMFQLSKEKWDSLRFQFGTLKQGAHSKYLPYAFTEHGTLMLASILNSTLAIRVNSAKMHQIVDQKLLTDKMTKLSQKVMQISAFLDEFQDAHVIIKWPDKTKFEGAD